jgi:type VII secretion integral membrane protein EccD
VVAFALAGLAGALSRAFCDAGAGRPLAYVAVLFAAVGGATAFASDHTIGGFGTLSVLGGAGAALVMVVVAVFAVADGVPGLLGVGVAALVVLMAAALDAVTGVGAAGTAAVAVVLALGLTQPVPVLALRLAELPLPMIPFTADDVRQDTSMVDGADVLRRTVLADAYAGALVGSVALVVAAGQAVLARQHGAGVQWMMAVVATACALRARAFPGWLQRSFLLAAAAVGAGMLALCLASQQSGTYQLLYLVAPLVGSCVVLVVTALRLPGHRASPLWRRATDLLDSLVVLSLIPVALNVLGVYGYVRGFGS